MVSIVSQRKGNRVYSGPECQGTIPGTTSYIVIKTLLNVISMLYLPLISFVDTQVRGCCDFVGREILIDSENFYEIFSILLALFR